MHAHALQTQQKLCAVSGTHRHTMVWQIRPSLRSRPYLMVHHPVHMHACRECLQRVCVGRGSARQGGTMDRCPKQAADDCSCPCRNARAHPPPDTLHKQTHRSEATASQLTTTRLHATACVSWRHAVLCCASGSVKHPAGVLHKQLIQISPVIIIPRQELCKVRICQAVGAHCTRQACLCSRCRGCERHGAKARR